MPDLLGNIVRGASAYFMVIFTGHLLLVLFELFAPVSDYPADPRSFTHYELRAATDSTPSCEVSHRLGCCNEGEINGVPSPTQWEWNVGLMHGIRTRIFH